MTQLSNNFEGGSEGTDISTVNSGGASGDAFAYVSRSGVDSIVKFAGAAAYAGNYGMRTANRATAGEAQIYWGFGPVTDVYNRFYFKVTDARASNGSLFWLGNNTGSSMHSRIDLQADGHLVVRDAATNIVATSTLTVTVGSWYRVEFRSIASLTVSQLVCRLYANPDDAIGSYTEELATAATWAGTADVGTIQIGSSWTANWPSATGFVDYDFLVVGAPSWVGPATVAPPNSGTVISVPALATASMPVLDVIDSLVSESPGGFATGVMPLPAISPSPTGQPPINTVPPVVTGSPIVGQTLSCSTGTWTYTGSQTFTYQWQSQVSGVWTNIGGATSSTFLLTESQFNLNVRCVVTDTDSQGTGTANSNSVLVTHGPILVTLVPATESDRVQVLQVPGPDIGRRYRVRIAWAGRSTKQFRIGVSKIAPAKDTPGYDVIGDNFLVPSYNGAYNTIADDEYGPLSFTCTRGRDDPFSNMLAGQLDLILNDVYPGRYNPKNPLSVLAGKLRPMRPCCLDITTDDGKTWTPIFNGWLDELSSAVDWDQGEAKLVFKDIFLWLDKTKNVTIPSTGPITVGVAIGLCLDALGWPTTARSLDHGSLLPDFSVSPGTSLLSAISSILQTDLGYFFHAKNNVVTYWDRYQVTRQGSVATFQVAKDSSPGIASSSIKNTASATRQYDDGSGNMVDGVPQYYQDSDSIDEFGAIAWDDVTSPNFSTDADALGFCQMRVALGKNPVNPVWTYSIMEDPNVPLTAMVEREFLDRVSIVAYGATTDYLVQKITHHGEGGTLHQTDLVLGEAPTSQPFVVGRSKIAPTTKSAGYDRIWH